MAAQECRILIVDDVPDNLFLLQILLENEGYEVELADSGPSALAKILASPCLVLLDVMMPQMNGIEVTRLIRQYEQFSTLPIVLLTATEEAVIEQALRAGANGCLRKPINLEEVLQRIQSFCEA